MSTETQKMQTMFAQRSVAGADASHVAEMAVVVWKDISLALAPIFGDAGVAALFKRSIYLTRSAHPCLATVLENKTQPDELAAMQVALAHEPRDTAVAANAALLQNFQDLLTSLIGLSLTDRLLRPVWDKPSSGQTEQDITS